MHTKTHSASLHINGQDVGKVNVLGWHGAWGFGDFVPDGKFAEFEPLFSRWSELMHRSEVARRLTPKVSDALRAAEYALYKLDCKLHLKSLDQWRNIAILNIDGGLIEWKESPSAVKHSSVAASRSFAAQAESSSMQAPRPAVMCGKMVS